MSMIGVLGAATAERADTGALTTLGMLGLAAATVLALLVLTVRLDPAAMLRRRRHERYVRRATDALLREAERARREPVG